jgi:hypothetical protein
VSNQNKIDNSDNVLSKLTKNVASNLDIFTVKPMAKYLSGARCVLRVNGKIIGFAFAISWDIKTSVTEINTIDDYMPYELAPQRIEVTGAISGFRIPGSGPSIMLIQTDIESFLHQRYIDIEVRDSQTDNLIFLANKALITSRTENIKIDQLADMTLSFKAIGWADERSPKRPDGVGESVNANGTSSLNKLLNRKPSF